MRANDFTTESAVEELKNKLPSLKNTSYDTIDELMQNISHRYKLTGKKLHDLFVHKYGHTPDTWIKKIKNRLSEYGDEIVAEGPIQQDYPAYGGKDPNKTMTYDRLVGPGYAGEPWSDSTDNWSGEEGPKLPPNTKPTIRLSDKFGNEADYAVDSPQAKQVYADRMQKYGADANSRNMNAIKKAFSNPVDSSKVKTLGQSDSTSDFSDSGLDNEIIPSNVITPTTPTTTSATTNTDTANVDKSLDSQKQPIKPITPSASNASSTAKPPKPGSWQELAQLNKITDPTKLQAGTKIKTPSGDEIPVAKGDTLSSIAKSLATTGQPPSQLNPKPYAGRATQQGATTDPRSLLSPDKGAQAMAASKSTTTTPAPTPIAPVAAKPATNTSTPQKPVVLDPKRQAEIAAVEKARTEFNDKLKRAGGMGNLDSLPAKNPPRILPSTNESITNHLVNELEMFLESKLLNDDWQKVNKRDKTDGMSRKAVKAYRRENPGSKLKTAVTTKPSKLKKGSKSAKRRKSFCARMSGMKKAHASAKTKRDPNSPINKALRRWNCESIEEMQNLMMIAEQKVAEAKNLKQQAAIAIAKKKGQNVTEDVKGPDEVQQIKDFIKWSMKTLNVKTKPKFTLSKNTDQAQAGHHTGVHSGDRIWVYIGNRNLIDIFRTIFHELVHQRQEELNMIKDGDSYPGSPIEAMADMMAGKYIKIYGKEHPEIFQ
jgi:LysM repeat protein